LAYRIEYKFSVVHDIKHLDKGVSKRIVKELEDALSHDPDCGEALSGKFKGLFKLRIGDYRIIYYKKQGGVMILRIGNRSKAYR
jgi:mRNA interferase RelE/StbE